MMKRFISLLLASLMMLALFLAGCGGAQTSTTQGNSTVKSNTGQGNTEKVIELNFNNPFSSTHFTNVLAFEPWAKLVEEKTGGRVKVNIFHGGALGSSLTVWQDVKGGVYDVGIATTDYFADTKLFPYTIGGLPFAFSDVDSAVKVMKKFVEKYGQDANDEVIVMGVLATAPHDIVSNKPIRSVDDVKGMKIRGASEWMNALIQAWGASPVTLSVQELYTGLERSTVDAVVVTPPNNVSSKLYEVAPYMTKLAFSTLIVTPLMSHDFFNKLPDDLKTLFEQELNPKLAELYAEAFITETENAYKQTEEFVQGRGEVITLSPEELEKFKAPAKATWDAWVESANNRGYPGEEMMNYFIELIQEEGLPLPF